MVGEVGVIVAVVVVVAVVTVVAVVVVAGVILVVVVVVVLGVMVVVVVVVDVVVVVVVEDVLISNCSIEVNISVKSVATDSSNFTSTSARIICSVSLHTRFLDAIILSQ